MKTILPLQLLVTPDLNDPQPLILYHGRRCPDGFGAMMAARLFYGDSTEYLGLDHGDTKTVDDLPPLAGRAVYILDFSFAPEIMQAIEARAAKLVMLDHHKSAAEKLTGFACRCGVVHFDMNKSGARLAWEFFHPDEPVPALLQYVEDRDIWKWEFAQSAPFLSALDMEEQDFARWSALAELQGDALDPDRGIVEELLGNQPALLDRFDLGQLVGPPGRALDPHVVQLALLELLVAHDTEDHLRVLVDRLADHLGGLLDLKDTEVV